MFTRRAIVVAAALTVTSVTAASVHAQSPEPPEIRRPYRGMFGGPSSSEGPHSLTLSGSAYGAYDDNVYEAIADRRVGSPWLQQSGTYLGLNAGLNYTFQMEGERFDLRAQTGAQVTYFLREEESDALPAYQGNVEMGAQLTQSLSLGVRQNVGYTSLYASTLAPRLDEEFGAEIGVPDDPDLGLFQQRALYSATRVNLSQTFGRYSTLGVSYHVRNRRALESEVEDSVLGDYVSHAATAGFQYARPMTRNATLRLGYGIRWSDRQRVSGEPDLMHNIDVGVDYSRALSFSRRTFFTFGTGSAITVSDEVPATDTGQRVRAWLLGNAALVHEMGRTWTADLRYSRGFRTREGFDQLYFTDALTASIGGFVSRRLSLNANATWAESSLDYDSTRQHSNQYATAQATFGLTSFLAAYARYVYVKYRFDENVSLDPTFPRQLDRHGIRVGLTTSVPLIR